VGAQRAVRERLWGARTAPALGTFERYLTLWVALCIIAGIILGQLFPAPFHALGQMNVAEVNIPVAALIWLMIVPMLLKVDFGALHQVAEQWRGIAVTVGINWLIKPFSMAVLGWIFIGWLFRPWLPPSQIDSRRPLHGDGVRLGEPDRWRPEFHGAWV
jgi:ACR3 family arsenite transporter